MVDTLTQSARSRVMSRIKSKDTKPEILVRRIVHSLGFRYRLHVKELPGCPDMVFRRLAKVIFVHGCFWHQHKKCKLAHFPKSRHYYWEPKLNANRRRDSKNTRELAKAGWSCLVIWECEMANIQELTRKLKKFLNG